MYSHEIQQKLENNNFSIPVGDYLEICDSNQISQIKYNPYGDYFEIWTKDNYYWMFKVFKD